MSWYAIIATKGRGWPVFWDWPWSDAANFAEGDDRAVHMLRDGRLPVRETPIGEGHAPVLSSRETARGNGRPQHPTPRTST